MTPSATPWPAPPRPVLPGHGHPVLLHDTASGALVDPVTSGRAGLYVCGITPYDATHLGHAATYLAFDLLHRAWLDAGLDVRYVQNVTDVDDPLLERATATGVDWQDLAREQTRLFTSDMTALEVLPPHAYVGAVAAIPQLVPLVEQLLDAGYAYQVPGGRGADGTDEPDGDVYFSVAADPRFGGVSHLDQAAMTALFAERGGDPERPGKKHPLDSLLWRVARPGEPSWPGGRLGPGRPGWHIECAAIALAELGTPFEVQGGGCDLIFPHHEMSAAHAQALTGRAPFARAYVHAGMVALAGEKMSKSRGNLVFVSRLLAAGRPAAAIRLAVLAHHYRQDWEWTEAGLVEAEQRLQRWQAAFSAPVAAPAEPLLAELRERLADDLDAPGALAAVDRWVAAGRALPADGDGPAADTALAAAAVRSLLGVDAG